MKSSPINKDDLVAVLGATLASDGVSETHYILARVISAGKSDLFVKDESRSIGGIFKVSSTRCIKINLENTSTIAETEAPVIGNLVLSLVEKFGSIAQKTGILMEIVDFPGKTKLARILQSEELELVPYESLIVLE